MTRVLLIGLLGCLALTASAQDAAFAPARTHVYRFDARADGPAYQLIVTVPEAYGADTTTAFPVLYYLDGWDYAPLFIGLARLMEGNNTVRPFILAGISIEGDRLAWARHRYRDYTPSRYDTTLQRYHVNMAGASTDTDPTGEADAFADWIENTAISHVMRHYRTSARAVAGHSFGGLFGVWAMRYRPDLFSRYLLVSPSLWWNGGEVLKDWPAPRAKRVFLSVGGREFGNMQQPYGILLERLQAGDATAVEGRIYEGENHVSLLPEAVYDGLTFLFAADE